MHDSDEENFRGLRGPIENRSYLNDDYTKHAGPFYREERHHPGVSGKSRSGDQWFNDDDYEDQRSFIGRGPRGYRRSDEVVYEETCEALKANPLVDASGIEVRVEHGVIYLEGFVDSRVAKRKAELAVEDIPGVTDVCNALRIEDSFNEIISQGPSSITQTDVGRDRH